MSIYQDIILWSQSELSEWQRDALRRIVQTGNCDGSDIVELLYLCKKEAGIPIDSDLGIDAIPIQPEDVPVDVSEGSPVRLTGLGSFFNVNRISADAALSIPDSGLTVVFGNNGAGKSGYIRVLKKACRARGCDDEEVHPNIYSGDEDDPSAVINYKEGDEVKEFEWNEDGETPPALSAINVFDSKSAQIHVSEENELLYRPFGTDLIPALIEVVDKVATEVRAEMRQLTYVGENFPEIEPRTAAGVFVNAINSTTTDEQIAEVVTFSEIDEVTLKRAKEQLSSIETKDPTKEIGVKQRVKASLLALKEVLTLLPGRLDEGCVNAAIAHRTNNVALTKAATEAAQGFNNLEVSGVGGEAWKELWESARRYSEEVAYRGFVFPNLDGRCVLCHQNYSDDAGQKMQSFEAFVKNDIQTKLHESNHSIEQSVREYEYIQVRPGTVEAGLAVLDDLNPDLKEKCESLFVFYEARKQFIIEIHTQEKEAGDLTAPKDPSVEIDALVVALDTEMAELEKQKTGEISKDTLQVTINELDAKRLAFLALPRIKGEIQRQKMLIKYQSAIQTASTTQMTNKSKQLSDAVSGELAANFVEEIKKLRVQHKVDVELQSSGARKGVTYHKIVSPTANGASVPLLEVLSEGEFKAVAIAAFMTEVNLSPSKSGIIFDDPVTSLDHDRKAAIATRIIAESKERQVVVFTHDLPFVFDLANAAKKDDVNIEYRTMFVNTGDKATGNIEEDLPWDGKTPEKRIKELKARLQTLTAAYKNDDPSYSDQVDTFNNKLRQTWESAVEKILLHNVVRRFDREVRTSEIRYLVGNITESDNQKIADAITKCGPSVHDTPEGRTEPLPEPEELAADLNNLEEWVTELKKRQGAA